MNPTSSDDPLKPRVDDGIRIRLKSSYRGEQRTRCAVYRQESLYGLKHSVEGWVTRCPSSAEELGVHLPATLTDYGARARLRPLLDELTFTRRIENLFAEFLSRRGLNPAEHRTIPLAPVAVPEGGNV
ncbi:hypothetical protein [Salinispora pacifica]|uniref:hypothetical protein n=1 Tax=Salinispora pacifica TaxID=351187 RepID=UPI00047F1116|nr:hypothetical protein [Salinispora pacifica]